MLSRPPKEKVTSPRLELQGQKKEAELILKNPIDTGGKGA